MPLVLVKADPAVPGSPTLNGTDGIICSQCNGLTAESIPIIFSGMYPSSADVTQTINLAIRSTDATQYKDVTICLSNVAKRVKFQLRDMWAGNDYFFPKLYRRTIGPGNFVFSLKATASPSEGTAGVPVVDATVDLLLAYSRTV